MIDPNDAAFPQSAPVMAINEAVAHKIGEHFIPGLTKREYFAAMAMQALLSNPVRTEAFRIDTPGAGQIIGMASLYMADALIAELNK